MTNSKWLRRALLGGVAIGVMSTGAQADDLDDLKAQIEALQTRVNTLESTPSTSALPEGASLITFTRGQGSLADWNVDRAQEGQMPSDRGFTIAVTPTADVPAPVTEVTVSGYVKADFIWDFNQDLGPTFLFNTIDEREQNDVNFTAHAMQTRFRIRSRTDTAIGQIRTLIEGDFFGQPYGSYAGGLRLRHAWGEWDMTPNWTLGIGRFWRLGYNVFTGVTTVDFGGSIGVSGGSRNEQIRFTYSSGPLEVAFGIQRPNTGVSGNVAVYGSSRTLLGSTNIGWKNTPDLPGFGGHVLYDVPGGHQFFLGGAIQQNQLDRVSNFDLINKSKFGYSIGVGANANLADIATLTGQFNYANGLTQYIVGGGRGSYVVANGTNLSMHTNRAWGASAGISFDLTDTVTANAQWGFVNPQGRHSKDAGIAWTHAHTVHANIIWQPVRQMRLGWEVMWGRTTYGTRYLDQEAGTGVKKQNTAIRGQFGAWFFF